MYLRPLISFTRGEWAGMNYRPFAGIVFSAVVLFSLFYVSMNSASELVSVPAISELSDRILIIDAGHGGADGGAVSVTGKCESEINLEIAKRIKLLAEFIGYKPVMTRETEEIIYPAEADTIRKKKVADTRARVELVNSCKNGFLLSIHQNKYTSASPSGAQVFYKGDCEELAKAVQSDFTRYVNSDSKRTAKPVASDIYLFSKSECSGVLVECGFLSNPAEADKLETVEHQKLLSTIIMGNISNYL